MHPDPDKIERLIKIKREQKEEAKYIEDTKRLSAEIEILKEVVLFFDIKEQSLSSSFGECHKRGNVPFMSRI